MSTMLSFANNDLATSFMSKQDIAAVCPMALRHTPTNPNVSERYTFANTEGSTRSSSWSVCTAAYAVTD